MEFKKQVQFLAHSVNESNLHCYDFLDIESRLPFTIYSMSPIESYSKLEPFKLQDLNFRLVLTKTSTGIGWKVKAV